MPPARAVLGVDKLPGDGLTEITEVVVKDFAPRSVVTVRDVQFQRDPKVVPPPSRPDSLRIVALTLQPGEEVIVGKRIREVLSDARNSARAPEGSERFGREVK